jgi:hypothetical protein
MTAVALCASPAQPDHTNSTAKPTSQLASTTLNHMASLASGLHMVVGRWRTASQSTSCEFKACAAPAHRVERISMAPAQG